VFDSLRTLLLRFLRVPHSPDAPAGSAESTKVFHAGSNFYKWSVIRWAAVQAALLLGLIASDFFFSLTLTRNSRIPMLIRAGLVTWEVFGVVAYLVQFSLTFFALRLGYEMRWYIVTDRSLRIRSGVWGVEELTMTFANIQQITVMQGPLQGVLGIADVQVLSAGGSGGGGAGQKESSGHAGHFRGVENADAIRDLILERLRRYKDAGLGDADEAPTAQAAAQNVLQEARLLHAAINSISR